MNAHAMEPSAIDEFIFGDQLLHSRFSMAIEVLARIVVATPLPVTTAALSEALGQPPRRVRILLANLHRSGLIRQDEKCRDAWYGSALLATITLADIFRSVSGAGSEPATPCKKSVGPSDESRSAAQQNVDLLLMQATMEINQVVLQHLQSFDLGRLKALGTSASSRGFHPGVRSCIPEPA